MYCECKWNFKSIDWEIFESYPQFNRFLPHGFSIDFNVVDTNVPGDYKVWWKVRNIGEEAEKEIK